MLIVEIFRCDVYETESLHVFEMNDDVTSKLF